MVDRLNSNSNGHSLIHETGAGLPALTNQARLPQANESLYQSLIEVIWRRKIVILTILLLCVGYTYFQIQRMPLLYESHVRIYVSQNSTPVIRELEGLAMGNPTTAFLYVQSELLKSTPILTEALNLENHRQLPTFQGVTDPVGRLRSLLSVEVIKSDDSLEITCESPYPQDAATLANGVVKAYQQHEEGRKRRTAQETVAMLKREKESRDRELKEINDRMLAFKQQHGIFSFNRDGGNVVLDRLNRLTTAVSEWTELELQRRSKYEAAKILGDDPEKLEKLLNTGVASTAADQLNTELATVREDLRTLESQLQAARQRFSDKHQRVRELQSALETKTAQAKALRGQASRVYMDVIFQQWKIAEQTLRSLQAEQANQVQEAQKLNAQAAEYARMEDDARRVEKLADLLDSRIKEISVTEDVSTPTINVLEDAKPPIFPSKPQKTRLMLLGAAIGLFLGTGTAFSLDWIDRRIRSPEDVRSMVQAPILGIVPHMRRVSFQSLGKAVHLQPRSAVAEAYRTVRTAVYFSGMERPCHKIVVTSAAQGEGKTVTASNLAIAIAQAGQKAVIIDADFHRPKQHLIFGVPNEDGLSNVLRGQSPLENVVLTTPIARVDIVPSGPVPENPYELINAQAFREIFEVLKLHYDHIIIDSPPALAVADTLMLAAMADVTILVTRINQSRRQSCEEAVTSLTQVGARLLGVVVNDVHTNKERYSLYRTNERLQGQLATSGYLAEGEGIDS